MKKERSWESLIEEEEEGAVKSNAERRYPFEQLKQNAALGLHVTRFSRHYSEF